ncbi:hypothetical protein SAY86_027991 [Trapa natans]|uniref:Uncharacterized protein n=1 Tax=Trapa natans TaxID=22666 RepID=A0AAN7RBT0_TRANT|nr:hypothetical protein SAY86_027991 [Trapa natans]
MMGGGGSRRDERSFAINNGNVFAALEILRKKKKSDKYKASRSSSKATTKTALKDLEVAPVFWAPAPLNNKSWADVDDDDDDDYYATAEPLQTAWAEPPQCKEQDSTFDEASAISILSLLRYIDCMLFGAIYHCLSPHKSRYSSEEDILDEGDEDIEEDIEEEHDHEIEVPILPEPVSQKPVCTYIATKETERQLSKKERKKKELAELEALLADFAVKDDDQDESVVKILADFCHGKKDKSSSKEAKEDVLCGPKTKTTPEPAEEEDSTSVHVKERLKKLASLKKKKSSKEMDAAARAASQEAATRSAELAAAKKKEKNHYNQQPLR